jgi:7,8-dihydroneopterin aldolase/epimerase/oxygenase
MSDPGCVVALRGLECFGRHGVHAAERELGQRFVVDLLVELERCPGAETDELRDTVDYAALADAVAAIVGGPPVRLLERLAALIAERALREPLASAVEVTVRKPHVALPQPLVEASVTLRRRRPPR